MEELLTLVKETKMYEEKYVRFEDYLKKELKISVYNAEILMNLWKQYKSKENILDQNASPN